jgi:hypothetical protein
MILKGRCVLTNVTYFFNIYISRSYIKLSLCFSHLISSHGGHVRFISIRKLKVRKYVKEWYCIQLAQDKAQWQALWTWS